VNHIVLYRPEIPQNTGNIMRTAVAFNMRLHLIKPLGFSLDDKYLRRSGLDYRKQLQYEVHESFEAFMEARKGTMHFLTRYAEKPLDAADFNAEGDHYLIFGGESGGIDLFILRSHRDRCIRIPISDKVRTLNVSNAVAISAYEALRQQGYPSLFTHEPDTLMGRDFLDKE